MEAKVNQPDMKQHKVNQHKVNQPDTTQHKVNQHRLNMPEIDKPEVGESEIKGIETLSYMEKKHLLAQLSRDRKKDPKSGPWEITDIRRGGWETIKDYLIQPIKIELNDSGKEETVRVWFDITDLERELEAGEIR
ncbi:MAG: hypothetical protein AB3K77_13580 [Methanosarcinaceae archaeon]